MAWTAPASQTDGTRIGAATWNAQIYANMRYLKGIDGIPHIENGIDLSEIAAPGAPASGVGRLYAGSESLPWFHSDAYGALPLGRLKARVYHTLNTTLTNNVAAYLDFNNERFDIGGFHDNVTNNSRLTILVAGVYLFGLHLQFPENSTGNRALLVRLNGTTVIATTIGAGSTGDASGTNRFTLTSLYEFAVNDYIEAGARQSSGGNLDVVASAPFSPEFWIVGPL